MVHACDGPAPRALATAARLWPVWLRRCAAGTLATTATSCCPTACSAAEARPSCCPTAAGTPGGSPARAMRRCRHRVCGTKIGGRGRSYGSSHEAERSWQRAAGIAAPLASPSCATPELLLLLPRVACLPGTSLLRQALRLKRSLVHACLPACLPRLPLLTSAVALPCCRGCVPPPPPSAGQALQVRAAAHGAHAPGRQGRGVQLHLPDGGRVGQGAVQEQHSST